MLKYGKPPYLECSSRGDPRFSAFFATIKRRGGKSIESIYQAFKVFEGGVTGLRWQYAKGSTPININECRELYSKLWDEYIEENPKLLKVLLKANGLSDMFGQAGHACQAEELWRIRNEYISKKPKG